LTGVNPSAVHISGEYSYKHCANHCNQRCDDRSTVANEARGAHQQSAYYGTTNAHEDVHKRTIPIALKNSSGSPPNDCPDDNPCE